MQNSPKPINRRAVTAGLAWSVPAVAAVTAAPFAAASPDPVCPSVKVTTDAVKFPGGGSGAGLRQAYGFEITVTNTTPETIVLGEGSASVDFTNHADREGTVLLYTANPCDGGQLIGASNDMLVLKAGESVTLFLVVNETGNSANEAGCIFSSLTVSLLEETEATQAVCGELHIPKQCFSATPPVGC